MTSSHRESPESGGDKEEIHVFSRSPLQRRRWPDCCASNLMDGGVLDYRIEGRAPPAMRCDALALHYTALLRRLALRGRPSSYRSVDSLLSHPAF